MEHKTNSRMMLAVLFVAAFAGAYNAQCVSVALGAIEATLPGAAGLSSWLVSGYMTLQAIVMVVFAFLYRRFSSRSLFLVAAGIFVVGQLAAMFAPNFAVLMAARMVQACGGALFIPLMMNAVVSLSVPEKLASGLAIGNIAIGMAPSFAPPISGIVLDAFGWQSIFVLPLAVVVVCAVLGFVVLRPLAEQENINLDFAAVLCAAIALAAFVYAMNSIAASPYVGLVALVVALVFGWLFVRRQNATGAAVLNLHPLKNKTFAAGCVLVIITIMQVFSMGALLPAFYQAACNMNGSLSGALVFIPLVFMTAVMMASGKLFEKHGAWPLVPAGFLALLVGQVVVAAFGVGAHPWPVVAASILVYSGAGLVQSPIQAMALAPLPQEENPDGVSIINVCIQAGSAIGIALFFGVLGAVSGGSTETGAQAAGFAAAIALAALLAGAGLVVAVVAARAIAAQAKQ